MILCNKIWCNVLYACVHVSISGFIYVCVYVSTYECRHCEGMDVCMNVCVWLQACWLQSIQKSNLYDDKLDRSVIPINAATAPLLLFVTWFYHGTLVFNWFLPGFYLLLPGSWHLDPWTPVPFCHLRFRVNNFADSRLWIAHQEQKVAKGILKTGRSPSTFRQLVDLAEHIWADLRLTNGNPREPTGTNGNQREWTGTNGNQRVPVGQSDLFGCLIS